MVKILGLATADPILAGFYNRAYSVNSDFNYSTETPFEEGFIQLNHASAGVFREDNWIAVNKGLTNGMWGTEAYHSNNRYGRYQSYGALEIIYPGSIQSGNGYNVSTWDWNYNPGATVIRLPWDKLHGEYARNDETQQKDFVGSLTFLKKEDEFLKETYGTFGMFAMDFQEKENQGFSTKYGPNTHNSTFKFKKSNFFFDDIIVCLGSGISNDDPSNKTITTLYQRMDNNTSTPIVNGYVQDAIGEVSFYGGKNNWLISNYNTGFYVLSGKHGVNIIHEDQKTPNHNNRWPASLSSGTYYKAYIDHGTKPSDKSYEYIIMPNTTEAEMQQLDTKVTTNKPYKVHSKDSNSHVIEHTEKGIFGYAVFGSLSDLNIGYVKAINRPCLLMSQFENSSSKLKLAIVSPDLGFDSRSYDPSFPRYVNVTINGEWNLLSSHPGAKLVSTNETETLLSFTLVDGLSIEVDLQSTTLSLDDISPLTPTLNVYPNPSNGIVNISSNKNFNQVEIYDLMGRVLYNLDTDNSQKELQINLSNFSSSIYFINVKSNSNVIATKRLILN